MGAPALDGQPHHSDTRGRKHRRASERPLGRRAAVLKRNKHSHEPLDDEPLSPSPLSPSPPSSPLHALSLGAPAPAGTQMASMHALDTQAHAAAADEPAQSGNNTPIWPGPPTPRAKAFSRSNSGIFGAIAGSASPRRSQPASASQSPAGSRPGTPTSTAGFLQTIFDAASRMVSAPKNIAGVDRKDLPPLPSAFHTEEGQAQPGMAPNIHGHHPPLPSKLIIAPVKNAVAPITNSGNLPNNKGLAAVQAIVQGAAALSSPVAPPVVQTGISSADALAAAPSAPSATTPTVLVNGGSGGELTESPTSENFASPTDDSLSPARVAEKHRRRRRNPNARSPISPGPPPDSEIDTPTRVRTSQEVLEAKLDGNAVGIQEPGVEVAVSPQDGVVLRWQSGDDLFLLSENDAKDDANLPPLPSPLPPLTTPILWTVRQQQGYRKPPGHPLNVPTMQRMPLHQKCEDVHAPPLPPDSTHSDSASGVHPLNHNAYHLFVLADGHGGHGAAEWFVPRIREQVEELLRREDWEFSVEAQRCKFGEHITSIFSELDREYCDLKIQEFEAWKRECTGLVSTVGIGSGALSATDLAKRPADDGCTLVVNLIYRFHLLNCNVGDSRTVLARRWVPPKPKPEPQESAEDLMETDSDSEGEADGEAAEKVGQLPVQQAPQAQATRTSFNWTIHFASKDHSPDHPHRAHHIHRAGGLFINDDGTRRAVRIQPPHERGDMIYTELTGSRIYRPPNDTVKALGISHLKTLNLAGTMGDLLFKIAPAVISSRPDITFVRIRDTLEEGTTENGGWEHMILYTSDGVWDHLRQQSGPTLQNKAVMGFISGWVDRILTYGPGVVGAGERGGAVRPPRSERSLSSDADPDELGRALGTIASMLCEREAEYEPAMQDSDGNYQHGQPAGSIRNPCLYYPYVGRFDDITIGLCYIPVGGMMAASQGGSWKGKEAKVRTMASVTEIRIEP